MTMKFNIITLIALFSITTSYAENITFNHLNKEREQVTKQYVLDLQKADYKHIVQLFENNGMVVSTSRGKVDAKEFFYSFLPEIETAKTELHQFFINEKEPNRLAARFHFSFKLKDGEEGSGEYVDEFVFADKSVKLSAVYMFENLKYQKD